MMIKGSKFSQAKAGLVSELMSILRLNRGLLAPSKTEKPLLAPVYPSRNALAGSPIPSAPAALLFSPSFDVSTGRQGNVPLHFRER